MINRISRWALPVLFAALIVTIVVGSCQRSRLKEELRKARNNIEFYSDSVKTMELKNGELVEYNNSLIVDNRSIADELAAEKLSKKELEKELNSKINRLVKIVSSFKADTIVVKDTVTVLGEREFLAPFRYRDEFLSFDGKTRFTLDDMASETTVSDLTVLVPATIGITEGNQVFVHTENPNAHIQILNPMVVSPKKERRIGIGAYTGLGITYGVVSNSIEFGPQVGAGLYFKIF